MQEEASVLLYLPISRIRPNPGQPRLNFPEKELESLAQSIRENGLLQPLTVRPTEDGYLLIAGERRLRALRRLGEERAPCLVLETDSTDGAVLALVENLQRADLNCFEEAEALRTLLTEWKVSQEELGRRLVRSQSTVANKLRLLRFPQKLREEMLAFGINERQARAILRLPEDRWEEAVRTVARRGLNVRQTESYVEEQLAGQRTKARKQPLIKDVRIFLNTVERALLLMKKSGICAQGHRTEGDGYIEYVIRITG